MVFPIPVRWHLNIESAPRSDPVSVLTTQDGLSGLVFSLVLDRSVALEATIESAGEWVPETPGFVCWSHYCDVIMGTMTSQITSLTIVYSTVHSGADKRKHQSFASLAFVSGIHL